LVFKPIIQTKNKEKKFAMLYRFVKVCSNCYNIYTFLKKEFEKMEAIDPVLSDKSGII